MQGLSTQEVTARLKTYGPNEIPEKNTPLYRKFLSKLISPISLMLLLAALLSLSIQKVFDFNFILILLFINIGISLWQERKADNAIKKLNENLSQKIKTLRDGVWHHIDTRQLVPGDIVQLNSGDIIPADGTIVEAHHVSINESALTGESLPKNKEVKDPVFSGAFLVSGIAVITITKTGPHTNFGKTIFSVERIRKKSLLEKDVISISKFLTVLSLVSVIILTIIFLLEKAPFIELLTLDLSLVIAGIPISLPTVMTLIIEFGVVALAKKNVIVRRLSALEDLANVDFILTDKTGTLTQNKITVRDIYAYKTFNHNDVISYAAAISKANGESTIDKAIIEKSDEMRVNPKAFSITEVIPADSERKRSTVVGKENKKDIVITLGAPQIVEKFCKLDAKTKEKFEKEIAELAKTGYRTLAIAKGYTKKEKDLELIGVLGLSDTLRSDAKSVVTFLKENHIGISMVTGDNRAIAAQITKELSLDDGDVVPKEKLDKTNWDSIKKDFFLRIGAFAEILPEDKLKLVQKAKQFFVIAANGDGVNDLPAIKAANVGIAVKNAVTVLKATADIVLLSDGIAVIRDAVIESRKIFSRIYTYSLYRISESLRLIITITVLGIIYRVYPLTPLQIILVAVLNDIPIISLAFDKVKLTNRPAKINAKERFTLSSLYGIIGVMNSLILFFIVKDLLNFDWKTIQTLYFLKLTVSGHLLIYVARTKQIWFKFFPSKEVIWATTLTQLTATVFALTGVLMPTKVSFLTVIFVWAWAFFWMQIGEIAKQFNNKVILPRFSS